MALDWLPVRPDLLPRDRSLDARFGPPFAAQSLPSASIVARLWSESQPTFPSQHLRRPWRPPGLHVMPFVVGAAGPVPLRAWAPVYPDRLHRRSLPVADIPSVFYTSRATTPVIVQWLPSYPSQISRPRLPVADMPAVAQTIVPAPATQSWKAVYPDRLHRARALSPASVQAYAFYPTPIAAPDPPGLGFKSTSYPDRLYAPRSLGAGQRQTFVTITSPIPNPPPPTELTWLPTFPAQMLATRQPPTPAGTVLTATLAAGPVVTDLRWLPQLPRDPIVRPVRVQPVGIIAPVALGAVPAVASDLTWLPVYPLRFPTPYVVLASVSTPLLPSAGGPIPVPSTAICLRLAEEDGTQPTLATTATGFPHLAHEIGGTLTLADEEEC